MRDSGVTATHKENEVEEVIELEYPQGVGAGLFTRHEDVPSPTVENAAESDSDPLPVEICESEGGEI